MTVAVTVAIPPQIVGLFTVTTGTGLIDTVEETLILEHPVTVLVAITEYIPLTVALKVETSPGLVAPTG